METRIKQAIQDYPNHPKPGIIFKDLTPILRDPGLSKDIIKEFVLTYIINFISSIVF